MIRTSYYLKILRASAWCDLVVGLGFATPWSFAALRTLLVTASASLGASASLPAFLPEHVLVANLFGVLVVWWAIVRLSDTQERLGRLDSRGRFLFAALQLYALGHGAHPLIWGFVALELVFGIAQALPVHDGAMGPVNRLHAAADGRLS